MQFNFLIELSFKDYEYDLMEQFQLIELFNILF
jgi:hypothetical protein